jgi:plasmid stabilization system protein ParE
MAFEIVWSERARRELESIVRGIDLDNPPAAARFRTAIHSRVDGLSRFPRSAAVYLRKRGLEIRQLTYKKYRVFYQVRPRLRRVEIITIRHGARREPRLG